ncbi:hypothetical protein LO771_23990 [Streptacidiphilus sp. ASG 303]|uniref:hypothetical protein n=1 Tax=Streptacidiphilus sp. ASG 303 TaxID=2896847 RepID=UPI001E3A0E73|nr:hypothetical protein [Streptacidiphilus sp. ASG 303]MCD0485364.1 hypothetical protein [Streptacidiphilus sp. ASG 303]
MDGAGRVDQVTPSADLLSAGARQFYLEVVRSGGRCSAGTDSPDGDVLEELRTIGLLVPDPDDRGVLVAVDPHQLSAGLSAAWQRQALELISRSVGIASDLQGLVEAYRETGAPEETGGVIDYVFGKVGINQRLVSLLEGCSEEMLTAQPGGGRSPEAIKTAIERDIAVLRRGASIRTVYQPSARYSAPTRHYVESMTKEGGQVRTLAEPFVRLIVIDRAVAVIPVGGDTGKAAFVRDEAVISYLVGIFEGFWERAIPFTGGSEVPPQVVSRMRHQIVQFMLQGVGHRIIARRLGLSERTLARHIAEMREEYGAETLFQLGWQLAKNPYGLPVEDGVELP